MLNAETLRDCLGAAGVITAKDLILDSLYRQPSREWVEGDFAAHLGKEFFKRDMRSWTDNSKDCDKFAFSTFDQAHLAQMGTPNGNGTGLAFGVFLYVTRQGNGHAINFFIAHENGQNVLYFFEPQTREIITLTQEEKAQCIGYTV